MGERITLTQRVTVLEERFRSHCDDYEELKSEISQVREDITVVRDDMVEIKHFMLGDDYDQELNGGLIKLISNQKARIDSLSKWRVRINAIWLVVGGVASALITFVAFNWANMRQNFIEQIIHHLKEAL